ncbi:hypothetical protein QTI33_08390 [Variovorax sp. J22P271]|uniref:hypothetical protein n=1 Tax=Variovorax davisae TaxID=3053515 RepID=UPI002578FE5C|nr:hypothetical protein [Variovorax sp. J22P271]MDM0032153.1 hypothetical protein [Variovorax sp. J22P271]
MIAEDPDRNWDCCVNGWEAPPGSTARDFGAERFQPGALNKFEAFSDMCRGSAAGVGYRYVLMIDDDLRFKPGDVSRFFEHCERNDLFLSQPAIAWGSNSNHLINICNPVCTVRGVNFVEVMAPCFSREALDRLLPTFLLTRCTWGIDYAWSSLLDGLGRISIVDAVAMDHTKPMDRAEGPFYRKLRSMNVDPDEELAEVVRTHASWGEMQSLKGGHRYRWPLPQALNQHLVAWMEKHKIQQHLARGGTIAPQSPVSPGTPVTPAQAAKFADPTAASVPRAAGVTTLATLADGLVRRD